LIEIIFIIIKITKGGIVLSKRFLLLLLMLVMVVGISSSGQALEREISLEDAGRILNEYLLKPALGGELVDPVGINSFIEIVGFANPTGSSVYYVQSGDTLYKIAQRYGTTVNKIKEANSLYSDYLYIGQSLNIPDSNDSQMVYYVKSGDALYKIAQKYNTTVNQIKGLNNLNSDFLYIGQKLLIPLKNVETNLTYYVKSGDTLHKIASRYGTTVQNIKTSNKLYSDYLYIGQRLSIPINTGNNSSGGRRINTSKEDMDLLARAVYSEARGETYEGQVAIAAVVINRVLSPLFPNTIRGVVYQPWQFTAVHDGQFWLQPNQRAYQAAEAALDGWDPTGGALFYYNPRTATSSWVFYRKVIVQIGEHVFAV